MNKHVFPTYDDTGTDGKPFQTDARTFISNQRPMVSIYARELYEAAVAAEADWDSPRAQHRMKRMNDAWSEIKRIMENG